MAPYIATGLLFAFPPGREPVPSGATVTVGPVLAALLPGQTLTITEP